MIYSRNYSRLFITLKQDRTDFCYDTRIPMGRCIFEIRNNTGKIRIFIQGLKPRILYRVMLVKEDNNSALGINAGLINIDEKGKGDCSISFNPDDIFSSGFKIEDIGAVLIIVAGIGELATVLNGFTDKAFDWKNNFKIINLEEKQEEAKKNVEENDDKRAEHNLKNEKNKDTITDTSKKADIKMEKNENNISMEENESFEETSQVENKVDYKKSEINSPQAQKNKKDFKDFNSFLKKFRADMLELEHYAFMTEAEKPPVKRGRGIQGIDQLKKNNMQVKPFEKCDEEIIWFKIMPCELTQINVSLWRYLNNPFINCCFRKYRHLILGIEQKSESEAYIIGVPEKYDESFCKEAEQQGFKAFKPRDDKKLEKGDFGYWLLKLE